MLARPGDAPRSVYVRGVRVAEDDGLLFSYNVTKVDAKLRRALNRERSNVGRSAYTDRIKAILLAVEDAGRADAASSTTWPASPRAPPVTR